MESTRGLNLLPATDAVPVDQMEYGEEEPVPTLWLPSGEFRVRIVDESGKTLHEYSTAD